jgi:diphthine-ammonia ligase
MKAFVSWSGGKDCMLALHRIQKEGTCQVSCLINMCSDESDKSRSHGLPKSLIRQQSQAMGIPIIQPVSGFGNYETVFKETISQLKKEGVEYGIFGDIYLMEHRTWIERVCSETDITPLFPLWNCITADLIREFVKEGFKAQLVSVNTRNLSQEWLGRQIDMLFIEDILGLQHIDPCAENGEYHSFVYDGPNFNAPVSFRNKGSYLDKEHWFQDLEETVG